MHTGHVISGAGHLTLIVWALFGGVFRSDPPEVQVSEVSIVTGAEFEAILAAQRPPEQVTDVAQPQAPEVTPEVPQVAAVEDAAPAAPQPDATEAPPPETPPEAPEQTPPQQAEVSDEAPTLDEPVGDVAVLVPEVAPEAVPRAVERVAPEPVAQPDPEATPDIDQREAVAPDETGETVEEPQEATAPEEATTDVTTEATAAPSASARPPGRRPAAPEPTQVVETPAPEDTPAQTASDTPAPSDTDDAVAAALAAVEQSLETPATPAPSGPPLTRGEKESLRLAVARCFNVGPLSTEAMATVIVVSVAMNENGTPNANSLTLDSFTGGSSAAAQRVFAQARSAVIRCGQNGFPLPAEKYAQWRNIEITFDPRKMR